MIIVYPDGNKAGGSGRYLRPTPLISITQNPIKNKLGQLGSTYDITLNGAIVTGRKSTIVDDLDEEEAIPQDGPFSLPEKLPEILYRQNQLREFFANDGVFIEITDINNSTDPKLSFYAKVNSINFEEGIYVDICRYSISLTADYLIDSNNNVLVDGMAQSGVGQSNFRTANDRKSIEQLILDSKGLVEDFNDTWSLDVNEDNGSYKNGKFIPRSYTVSRNMTATGRKIHLNSTQSNPLINKEAWEHARDFLKFNVQSGIYSDDISQVFTSGFLGFDQSIYRGFNHVRTENFDKSAGSYSVSDTWLLASGDEALETYNLSVSTSIDAPNVTVSIDGTIKGLSPIHASGYVANDTDNFVSPYDYAYQKYNEISNTGQFGISCDIYKRANNAVAPQLNSQPRSISLGLNETAGEITYNLEFDNRPTNYFNDALSESINVNDTYPGDIFAIIPVIGRPTGPILQYIGGRSEYKRDLNIEIRLDYTDLGYNNDRNSLLLTKPSLNPSFKYRLNALIDDFSPRHEPGIRKYFLSPPSESWTPKEGTYTISLSWTYELDR